jgi:hypothetical protein
VSSKFYDVFRDELGVINFRRRVIASRSNLKVVRSELGLAAPDICGEVRLTAPTDLTGLALSGGGIRSASFSLGVLQALHSINKRNESGVLDAFDYVSTVSGGGYIGSSLISCLMRGDHSFPFDSRLGQEETNETKHLRDYSNYLAPNGIRDYLVTATTVMRGLLVNAIIVLPALLLLASITLLAHPAVTDLRTAQIFGVHVERSPLVVIPGYEVFTLGINLLAVFAVFLFGSAIYTSLTFKVGTLRIREVVGNILAVFLVFVFAMIFAEVQPFILLGMAQQHKEMAIAIASSSILPSSSVNDFFTWLGNLMPALAGVLGPVAVFLVAAAQKLANVAKASVGEATWSAWLRKYSSRMALYAAALIVPLLLWIAYLYFAFWGLRLNSPQEQAPNAPTWLSATATSVAGWTDILPNWTCTNMLPNWTCAVIKNVLARLGPIGVTYLIVASVLAATCLLIGPNANSLHRLYRDRLSRAFLFRRFPDETQDAGLLKFSALKPRDKSGNWCRSAALAPYLLMNTAINLEASAELNRRGRNADTFIFSPLYVGSRATGYVQTKDLEEVVSDMSLATAMAISGAAASANMGNATKKTLTFSLSLLNIRLGYWLANPARVGAFSHWFARWFANVGTFYFALETAGQLDERKLNVYLTDGGHIENLGIYELLRRHCKVIVAVDAEADPDMTFPSLTALQVIARIDLGITIDLSWQAIQKQALGVTSFALYGPGGPPGSKGPHAAIGLIRYGAEETGVLIYIKSSLTGDEGDYVLDYKRRHNSFPHETTVDQFFGEEQFEVYRALGFHAAHSLFTGADDFAKPFNAPENCAAQVKHALCLLDIPEVMSACVAARLG